MFNNNLTGLLKTFSSKEIKEFGEFLDSSYFNKRQAVKNLYEALIRFHPEYDSRSLTREKIFNRLFPGKRFNDSSLRVLTHYLTELAERFLTIKKFESTGIEYSLLKGNVLFEREQEKLLEKNISVSNKNLDRSLMDAEDYYNYKFRLRNQLTFFRFATNYGYFEKIISQSGWEDVFKDLSNYYTLKSMIMYLNTLNFHEHYNKKDGTDLFQRFISNLRSEDYEDIPVIKLFHYLILLKTNPDHESYYFELKKFLKSVKKDLNKYDLIGAYVQMGAYCNKRISEGEQNFEKERFELYKDEIEEKTYLMSDNTMSPVFYRNVVKSGLTLKKLKWTKDFIYKYRPELNKKFMNNYFNICLAMFEFSMKNFENSLMLISKIEFDEIYMKLNTRILYLQLLYELGYDDTLSSSLESFRHFINNNLSLSEEKKIPVNNFHKFLGKIFSQKYKKRDSDIEMLKISIFNQKSVVNKEWLLDKVSLL